MEEGRSLKWKCPHCKKEGILIERVAVWEYREVWGTIICESEHDPGEQGEFLEVIDAWDTGNALSINAKEDPLPPRRYYVCNQCGHEYAQTDLSEASERALVMQLANDGMLYEEKDVSGEEGS